MNEISIQINWVYFLGILGGLVTFAWYSSSRFTRMETDLEWMKKDATWTKKTLNELKDSIHELRLAKENDAHHAFQTESPIQLTDKGQTLLVDSGLKDYLDETYALLCEKFHISDEKNSYEIQEKIFSFMDSLEFDEEFDESLHKYAYDEGMSTSMIRRIGAIYFRNKYMDDHAMNIDDIDNHSPEDASSDDEIHTTST